ncbi:N-acetyltransferase family protein [Leeia sp.]|uniref:GNAT family N-acetyltransferase n=1 Tax=Leeia sp. TaxID=2884678 RepID=UPI0035B26C44
MPAVSIRPATPADQPALRQLFLTTRRIAFHWQPPDAFQLDDLDAQTVGEALWVAVDAQQRLAGFIALQEADHFIHHLFVSPDHQRLGVGQRLLQALPGWGHHPFQLKCLQRNQPALAFYQAQGFHKVGNGDGPDGVYDLLEHTARATA